MEIALSQDVIDVIDEYMNHGKPVFKGYESFGFEYLLKLCEKWWDENFPIKSYFSIKLEHEEQYKKYMARSNWYISDSYVRLRRCSRAVNYTTYCQTVTYFSEDQGETIRNFIKNKWGSLGDAIKNTRTVVELWNEYEQWFQKRKERFMKKNEIEVKQAQNIVKKKIPQSHGGVANLLKTLTKTMEQQGADIRSIAKVQYAICTQAGIYIPDEFIRDVAVTLEMGD